MDDRKVKRVLVMLDYGPEDSASGEVFDVTALVSEITEKSQHKHGDIQLTITASSDYDAPQPWPLKTTVEWRASFNFEASGRSGHLDDCINASMPDSMATSELRKKLKRVRDRAEKLSADIQVQRLLDASKIRAQNPIARVRETPLLTV